MCKDRELPKGPHLCSVLRGLPNFSIEPKLLIREKHSAAPETHATSKTGPAKTRTNLKKRGGTQLPKRVGVGPRSGPHRQTLRTTLGATPPDSCPLPQAANGASFRHHPFTAARRLRTLGWLMCPIAALPLMSSDKRGASDSLGESQSASRFQLPGMCWVTILLMPRLSHLIANSAPIRGGVTAASSSPKPPHCRSSAPRSSLRAWLPIL